MTDATLADNEADEFFEVEAGGFVFEIPGTPDTVSEDFITDASEAVLASSEYDEFLDKETGAPARVRMLVGSAPIEDRLANLQRFYPDAFPHGEGNFVFEDPATGRMTLYNPEGLDFGDVASVAREGTIAAFSGLGAVAGSVSATPGFGTVVGAGTGAAVGGELFDLAMNNPWFGPGIIDTRGPVRRVTDAGTEFFAAAAGQRVGEIAGPAAHAVLKKGDKGVKLLVDKFRQLNIDPPGSVTSRTVASMEKALDNSPLAMDVIQKNAERVMGQVQSAADDVVRGFGTPQTQQGAGGVIRDAAKAAAERFGFKQEEAYAKAFDLIGADTPVSLNAVAALRETMERELAQAPGTLRPALGSAIRQLQTMEADAAEGMTFGALRQARTMIGQMIDEPVLAGSKGVKNAGLKRIYAALTEDMSATASAAGGDAAKALKVADRFTRIWERTAAKTMNKIGKFDADEKAFRYAMNSANDGGTVLGRLRRHFESGEWDTVAASVLNKMGLARPGAQDATGEVFSVNTFLTNWNKMSPEAKEALFGGTRYADIRPGLDRLVAVSQSLKEVEKLANTSNTARAMITWMTIQAAGGGLVGATVGGDVEGAGAGAAVALFAPRVAAKLITHPAFVNWLATPVSEVPKIGPHIARLAFIAEVNPEIREEVHAFAKSLRGASGEQGEP